MMNSTAMQDDRFANRPLHTLFVITSMPVGGAETLLVELVRRFDRWRICPEICCLKELGTLGTQLDLELPVHAHLIRHKYDVAVIHRLKRLIQRRGIDAVVTVGAGDKMFWGRIAAKFADTPVVLAALHSTGWPDGVGRLNRTLTPWTDCFIAVAEPHRRYLVEEEHFPAEKVHVIPNGVDTERFRPDAEARRAVRHELQIDEQAPLIGIVAALRPEKNHILFVSAARRIATQLPAARFLIIGDGPERSVIERAVDDADLTEQCLLLGTRTDVPRLLAALDVFVLTSVQEANPVSILESLATGTPVVATRVGSVPETVRDGLTGYTVDPGDAAQIALRTTYLATNRQSARQMGHNGRSLVVRNWSLDKMVRGYERLIHDVYRSKVTLARASQTLTFGKTVAATTAYPVGAGSKDGE